MERGIASPDYDLGVYETGQLEERPKKRADAMVAPPLLSASYQG